MRFHCHPTVVSVAQGTTVEDHSFDLPIDHPPAPGCIIELNEHSKVYPGRVYRVLRTEYKAEIYSVEPVDLDKNGMGMMWIDCVELDLLRIKK